MTTESSYGMWWDPSEPDNRVAGELRWEPLKAPTLSLLDPPIGMWAGRRLGAGESMSVGAQFVPMLHGLLADQGAVTLLSCRFGGLSFGATSTHRLRVGHALTGVWLDDPEEAIFRRVEVNLPALAAMLGDYPVRPKKMPSSRSKQVALSLDDRAVSWRAGHIEATWRYNWSSSVGRTTTTFEMRPTLELTSPTPKPLTYWLEHWVVPTNHLLTISTGKKSNPNEMSGWTKKRLTPMEKSTQRIPVLAQGVGPHDYEYDVHELLIRSSAISENPGGLADVLERVRALETEQEVFVDLLTSTINYPDRPLRNRYLDLTSALEAFHSQRYGLASISIEDFKESRKQALAEVSEADIGSAHRKFLKRWLPSRPGRSLEERLRKLGRDAQVHDTWTVDAKRMSELRNDVAHGNTGLDARALDQAYKQAFDLSRRLVLLNLGVLS